MALDYGYHVFSVAIHLLGDVEKVFAWITEQKIVHGWVLDSPAMMIWKYRGDFFFWKFQSGIFN